MAVTPHVTTKFKLEPELNVGIVSPPGLCKASSNADGVPTGHTAVPLATAQVAVVQLSPVAVGSFTIELGALAGPRLAMVTV